MIYDLAQPYFIGMPHFPTHPPYLHGLTKMHGEFMFDGGGSSASDAIALGSHTGTHIDALNHFSCNGFLHGGTAVAGVQSYRGITELDASSIAPIVCRGVLLDVAGDAVLDADFTITPEHLEQAQRTGIGSGDVVLIRTGWAQYFRDSARYVNSVRAPGLTLEAAQWLSARDVFAAGSDTLAFEKVPSTAMPVHVHLLVESGIHIIEVLNLEDLARDRVYEFKFIAAPLKLEGATGAPVRPIAIRL